MKWWKFQALRFEIVSRVFRPTNSRTSLLESEGYRAFYGWIEDPESGEKGGWRCGIGLSEHHTHTMRDIGEPQKVVPVNFVAVMKLLSQAGVLAQSQENLPAVPHNGK